MLRKEYNGRRRTDEVSDVRSRRVRLDLGASQSRPLTSISRALIRMYIYTTRHTRVARAGAPRGTRERKTLDPSRGVLIVRRNRPLFEKGTNAGEARRTVFRPFFSSMFCCAAAAADCRSNCSLNPYCSLSGLYMYIYSRGRGVRAVCREHSPSRYRSFGRNVRVCTRDREAPFAKSTALSFSRALEKHPLRVRHCGRNYYCPDRVLLSAAPRIIPRDVPEHMHFGCYVRGLRDDGPSSLYVNYVHTDCEL